MTEWLHGHVRQILTPREDVVERVHQLGLERGYCRRVVVDRSLVCSVVLKWAVVTATMDTQVKSKSSQRTEAD